jgi:hypothetical protein
MLVTKGGDGALMCCDRPMEVFGAPGGSAGQPKPAGGEAKHG